MERRHDHQLVAGLLALWTLALAPEAYAQDDDATRARTLFEQGVTSMNAGDPHTATGYFQQSFDLYPRASTACNMAVAQERDQRPCDAVEWYQRCASLDDSGQFRDHANEQIAALTNRCTQQRNPFVGQATPIASQPPPPGTSAAPAATTTDQQSRVLGGPGGPRLFTYDGGVRGVSHGMLGGGIVSFLLGVGALIGGAVSATEAGNQAALLPAGGGVVVEGTTAADAYHNAETFSYLAIGLYVGSGVLGALGIILIAADLAQPGVFDTASNGASLRLALSPTVGGATADLRLRF